MTQTVCRAEAGNRRLWKHPEATLASAEAFLDAAADMILIRRLGRSA